MQGGPVDELLDMAVECPALDQLEVEIGRAADFVFMAKAQHSAGKDFLESICLGDLPGIGMTIIDGIVRTGRSRNTPPAEKVPAVVKGS